MLIVREARDTDADAIHRVAKSGTATLRKIYRPNEKAMQRRNTLLSGATTLVAVLDGQIAGVARYRSEPGRLHIFGVNVEEAHRRNGIARALLDAVAGIARERKLPVISLNTVKETGNVAVFQRIGFTAISESTDSLFESDTFSVLTDVYMERKI